MLTHKLLKFALLANVLLWGITIPFVGRFTGFNTIILFFVGLIGLKNYSKINPVSLFFASIFFIYAAIVFSVGPCLDGTLKTFSSIFIFLAQLAFCGVLVKSILAKGVVWSAYDSLKVLRFITVAAGLGYVFMLIKGDGGDFIRSGGIYLEPSHLAISAVPLVVHLFFSSAKHGRLQALLILSFLFLFSYSSTILFLLVAIFLPIMLGSVIKNPFSLRTISVVIIFFSILLLVVTQPKFEETLVRFNDVSDLSDSSNLSSLVYANGWQLLQKNIVNTAGLGLGFNAMGCIPRPDTEVTRWLAALNLEDQNYNDGSFMLSKVGSEFGYFGVFFILAIALYSLGVLFMVGRARTFGDNFIYQLWFATFAFSAFLRNAGGFFAGPTVLFIVSFMIFIATSQRLKRLKYGK